MLGGHLLTKIENGQRLHYYGVESQQFHTGTTMIKGNRRQSLFFVMVSPCFVYSSHFLLPAVGRVR